MKKNVETTAVIFGDNGETKTEVTLANLDESPVEIKANCANEGVTTVHPLRIRGPFLFSGDNSHYTREKVIFDASTSTISERKSMFSSKTQLVSDSNLTITKAVTLSKDIRLSDTSKITFYERVILSNNMTLSLGFYLKYKVNFATYAPGTSNFYLFGPNDSNDVYYSIRTGPMRQGDSTEIQLRTLSIHKGTSVNNSTHAISDTNKKKLNIITTEQISGSEESTYDYSNFINNATNEAPFYTEDVNSFTTITTGDFQFSAIGHLTAFTYEEVYDLFSAIERGDIPYIGVCAEGEED